MSPLDPIAMLISLSGVSLIIFLVWLGTRRTAPVTLGGEAGVREWIARELLAFQVGKVAVDVSDRRAIVTSADESEVALIFVMGQRPTFWRLPLAKIRKVDVRDEPDGKALVDVATGDFTRPHFSLTFPSRAPMEWFPPGVRPAAPGAHA